MSNVLAKAEGLKKKKERKTTTTTTQRGLVEVNTNMHSGYEGNDAL